VVKLVHRVRFTADRILEVMQAAAKRASHLGKTLRPEYEQDDREQKQQMGWLEDIPDHCLGLG
jgi:hypothetical protein